MRSVFSLKIMSGFGRLFLFCFRRGAPCAFGEARSVAMFRLDAIGDQVLNSPLMRELRAALPNAKIILVVQPGVFNLVEQCPYVDEVLQYDPRTAGAGRKLKLFFKAFLFSRKKLWKKKLDLALVPRWDEDHSCSSFLALFSGASRRVAYSEHATEKKAYYNEGFDAFFTDVVPGGGYQHEVLQNLDFLKYLGATPADDSLECWWDGADEKQVDTVLNSMDIPLSSNDIWLAVCAFSREAKRSWPLERYQFVCEQILQFRPEVRIGFVGGPEDRAACAQVVSTIGPKAVNLCGDLSLRQTAAFMQRCKLYVGGDTGPMHLAAATGCKVIMISCHPQTGSEESDHSPLRFGPWKCSSNILAPQAAVPPCDRECIQKYSHCIAEVCEQEVCEAILEFLK